jgi:hypothetical protein
MCSVEGNVEALTALTIIVVPVFKGLDPTSANVSEEYICYNLIVENIP